MFGRDRYNEHEDSAAGGGLGGRIRSWRRRRFKKSSKSLSDRRWASRLIRRLAVVVGLFALVLFAIPRIVGEKEACGSPEHFSEYASELDQPLPLAFAPPADASVISRTDSQIAFSSNRDGDWELYVMNADGSGQTRLTFDEGLDDSPSWSPDGRRIAFTSRRDGNSEIYVMDADGSSQRRLTFQDGSDWHPRWSPLGDQIAFTSARDGTTEVYTVNPDGGAPERVTGQRGNWESRASWSPDGSQLAFFQSDKNRRSIGGITVADGDGRNATRLTFNRYADNEPTWSPNGSQIAFVTTVRGHPVVCVMDIDGKNQKRITLTLENHTNPAWSPDGSLIAFTAKIGETYSIFLIESDGSNPRRLTIGAGHNKMPAWSPS